METTHTSTDTSGATGWRRPARRDVLGGGLAAALLGTLGTAPARADGTFPDTSGPTPTAAIRDYADLVRQLRRIERSARHPVTVRTLEEVGTAEHASEQGRDLYVATVGSGERAVWVQGRIHGNEPYGLESLLQVLDTVANNGAPEYRRLRESFTLHLIPVYNPDGSEANERETVIWDRENDVPLLDAQGREQRIDLNRDWRPDGFVARESRAWYEYWTLVQPEFALDVHHQGLKRSADTGDPVTFSLGISLAPGGPTLPTLQDGAYDVLTRQMQGHVYTGLLHRGHIAMDRYDVGNGLVIDIRGGVVSAMMLGLDWQGLNPDGHSNAAVFFETSGNTRDGSLGQKARGKLVQQNVLGIATWIDGLASGEVQRSDPEVWEQIPHAEVTGYLTDWGGIIPA